MFPRTAAVHVPSKHDSARLRRLAAFNIAQTTLERRVRPRRLLYALQTAAVVLTMCVALVVVAIGLAS